MQEWVEGVEWVEGQYAPLRRAVRAIALGAGACALAAGRRVATAARMLMEVLMARIALIVTCVWPNTYTWGRRSELRVSEPQSAAGDRQVIHHPNPTIRTVVDSSTARSAHLCQL